MKSRLAILAAALALVGTASAAPSTAANCASTTTTFAAPSAGKLLDGLGLTAAQKKAAQARLSQLGGYNYKGLEGIGLTPAQISAIQARLAAIVHHPEGWPCAPFKNRARVISFVRAKLVYNGFRPAMQFFIVSTRQVNFNAVQDGIQYYGVVVKTGPREITIKLGSTRFSGGGSGAWAYTLTFDA